MITDINRNCNCMGNMNSMDHINYMPTMTANMSMSSDNDCSPNREDILQDIKCLNFSIIELGLYLDTHPDDEKALCLHRKYCKEYRELTDKYQKVYGPLTIQFPCNKWRWLEEPWPWEGGNV